MQYRAPFDEVFRVLAHVGHVRTAALTSGWPTADTDASAVPTTSQSCTRHLNLTASDKVAGR
jgi:hypothetical protein